MEAQSSPPALVMAARVGDVALVADLLAAGADVNAVCPHNGETALLRTAGDDAPEIMRMLLQQPGIDVNLADHQGVTALISAVANEQIDKVACLLAAGARVNHADDDAETALIMAARYGRPEMIQMLLRQPGIDLELAEPGDETALIHAARRKNPVFVASLLAAGADMTRVNANGHTALKVAIGAARAASVEKFLLHGAQLEDSDCYPPVPSAFSIIIADLRAEGFMPGRDVLLRISDPHAFFGHLASRLQPDGATLALMQWLPTQGVRMIVAQRVAAVLATPQAVWRLGPGQAASAQQQMCCTLGALSELDTLHVKQWVQGVYQASGISSAAVASLTASAWLQLEVLRMLATQTMAQVGSQMLQAVIPRCLAEVALDYNVDTHALSAILASDGYCLPVAQAIALSWQAALAGVRQKTINTIIPAGMTMNKLMQFVREQTVLLGLPLFTRALQGALADQLRLAQVFPNSVQCSNDVQGALLRIQGDQLGRFFSPLS